MAADTTLIGTTAKFDAQIDEMAGVITLRMQDEVEERGYD